MYVVIRMLTLFLAASTFARCRFTQISASTDTLATFVSIAADSARVPRPSRRQFSSRHRRNARLPPDSIPANVAMTTVPPSGTATIFATLLQSVQPPSCNPCTRTPRTRFGRPKALAAPNPRSLAAGAVTSRFTRFRRTEFVQSLVLRLRYVVGWCDRSEQWPVFAKVGDDHKPHTLNRPTTSPSDFPFSSLIGQSGFLYTAKSRCSTSLRAHPCID